MKKKERLFRTVARLAGALPATALSVGLLAAVPMLASAATLSNTVDPWNVDLKVTTSNGTKDVYLDIDRNGKNDMFVRLTWEYDNSSATFRDSAMIGFLGAFQGNLSITGNGVLARYEAGHNITDADFGSGYRDDGAFLWSASWNSDGTPAYLSGDFPDIGGGSYTYDEMFGAEPPPITATPTNRAWSWGAWQNVGDTGYAVFRQNIEGVNRYGWIELTHGSVDVGMVGFTDVVAEIPEPSSYAMLLAGLAGLTLLSRRRAPK